MAMADTTHYQIGAEASCSDGVCGNVSRVVIDPVARVLTHLVVEPKHRQGLGRLVPVDIVEATARGVGLRCSMAQFEKLEPAEETRFLPADTGGYGGGGGAGYEPGQAAFWPYFGLGSAGVGGGFAGAAGLGMGGGMGAMSQPVTYDTVPLGEVAVRRNDEVHATDGDIGKVQGLVVDPRNRHVTHILLQEGHLWGRKEVAIPISAVAAADEGIRLNLTKQQVEDLPPADIDHSNR